MDAWSPIPESCRRAGLAGVTARFGTVSARFPQSLTVYLRLGRRFGLLARLPYRL